MKGDPTPVCHFCGDYLEWGVTLELSYLDARLSCIKCYVSRPEVAQAPNNREIQEALASIRKAGSGQV